jgi:hypothetical protein
MLETEHCKEPDLSQSFQSKEAIIDSIAKDSD